MSNRAPHCHPALRLSGAAGGLACPRGRAWVAGAPSLTCAKPPFSLHGSVRAKRRVTLYPLASTVVVRSLRGCLSPAIWRKTARVWQHALLHAPSATPILPHHGASLHARSSACVQRIATQIEMHISIFGRPLSSRVAPYPTHHCTGPAGTGQAVAHTKNQLCHAV